ncbi:MAG: hypothetical protein ACTSYX_10300 [Candidatus Thorarchaeota archaeon]
MRYTTGPGKILTDALRRGLSATLAIARDRITAETRNLYYGDKRRKGMVRVWGEAKGLYMDSVRKGVPDARLLADAENDIRRSFIRLLLKTSVKYGNQEHKRVRAGEGSRGYLNLIWDYAGARLRDVAMANYTFPKPSIITLEGGKTAIGYHGGKRKPLYIVRHQGLPELDLIDMIRSHIMELCRQCLRFQVPYLHARRYVDQLIHRLLPFVDYVYTDRRVGRSGFIRAGLEELREVVSQIAMTYGKRNGRPRPLTEFITKGVEDVPTSVETTNGAGQEGPLEHAIDNTTQLFERLVSDFKLKDDSSIYVSQVRSLIDNGTLTDVDAKKVLQEAKEESCEIGSSLHRFLSYAFPQPLSLSSIVLHGNSMTKEGSEILAVAEIPIANRTGRADIAVFRRKRLTRGNASSAPIFYEPVILIDIKTKTAFNLGICGVRSRARGPRNIVPEFVLKRRALTDKEWDNAITETPTIENQRQLDVYEKAIITEYREIASTDSKPPARLAKAILVVDAHERWGDIRQAIRPLVHEFYYRLVRGELSSGSVLEVIRKGRPLRMALRVVDCAGVRANVETERLTKHHEWKPLTRHSRDAIHFVFYVTVSARGPSGKSASVIAQRWHISQYLYETAHRRHRDALWIDLTGQLADMKLRWERLRISTQPNAIRRFIKSQVHFVELSHMVRETLYNRRSVKSLSNYIRNLCSDKKRPVIVVTGWSTFRRACPPQLTSSLQTIASSIVDGFPDGSLVIWASTPSPHACSNELYQMKRVQPFRRGSIWDGVVDEILWNVPLPPPRVRASMPAEDHVRAIVTERRDEKPWVEFVSVEPLFNWGERFRSGGWRATRPMSTRALCGLIQEGGNLPPETSILDVIHHLSKENTRINRDEIIIRVRVVPPHLEPQTHLVPRLSLLSTQCGDVPAHDHRVRRLLPISKVNRQREYREMQLHVSPPKTTIKPPLEEYLQPIMIDERIIWMNEIKSLRQIIKFIQRGNKACNEIRRLAERVDEILTEASARKLKAAENLAACLGMVRKLLETDSTSRELWLMLCSVRGLVPSGLPANSREYIHDLLARHPDVLLITGNHLFLMLLLAVKSSGMASHPGIVASLWKILQPWQLVGLGLHPQYPATHRTGKSVFNRHLLFCHLQSMARNLSERVHTARPAAVIQVGELVIPAECGSHNRAIVWLVFQRNSSSGMFAAAIQPRSMRALDRGAVEFLRSLVNVGTYWCKSDLDMLSRAAHIRKVQLRVPIAVAQQYGVQVLFALDYEKQLWVPIGHFTYTTSRFENVTLVRSVTLRKLPGLLSVPKEEIPVSEDIADKVDVALFIIAQSLQGCTRVRCSVGLEHIERMYRIEFRTQQGAPLTDNEGRTLSLLVNRTANLLEILRRPDFSFEPVVVGGYKLIWNRFRDIEYDADVAVVRPWVERANPLRGTGISLPPRASDLLDVKYRADIRVEVCHDPRMCPLRNVTPEWLIESEHLRKVDWLQGNLFFSEVSSVPPQEVVSESGLRHGACWHLKVHSACDIPSGLKRIERLRFTDFQIASLLRTREFIVWLEEEALWYSYPFAIALRNLVAEEARESWHLGQVLAEVEPHFRCVAVGTYLEKPRQWIPFVAIEGERITVGLRDSHSGLTRFLHADICGFLFRRRSDVMRLALDMLGELASKQGMALDRQTLSRFNTEITAAFEIYDIREDSCSVRISGVNLREDRYGGVRLYVQLVRDDGHSCDIPVTGHLSKTQGLIQGEQLFELFEMAVDNMRVDPEEIRTAWKHALVVLLEAGFPVWDDVLTDTVDRTSTRAWQFKRTALRGGQLCLIFAAEDDESLEDEVAINYNLEYAQANGQPYEELREFLEKFLFAAAARKHWHLSSDMLETVLQRVETFLQQAGVRIFYP